MQKVHKKNASVSTPKSPIRESQGTSVRLTLSQLSLSNASVSTPKSPIRESQGTSVRLTLSQLSLSNAKVFPLENIQMKQFYGTSSTQMTNEASPSIPPLNRTTTPGKMKSKPSKVLAIGLATLVVTCSLAAFAIGLYFLIINTRNTASSNTTTAATLSLTWATSGITAYGTGTVGTTANQFNNPSYIFFNSSNYLYVADYSNSRVQLFSAGSSYATTVAGQANGQWGTNSYYLNQAPYAITDSSGNLYVSDMQNNRVQYFAYGTLTGVTVAGAGGSGSSMNQLNNPRGLALDSNTNKLYIADTNNHRIMCYVVGVSSGTVVAGGNGQGTLNNQLNTPIGLYLDVSSNSLFIANCYSHNIIRWVVNASTWTLIAGAPNGQSGSTSTFLNFPFNFIFDSSGNLYVADTNNHRIQLFLSGQFNGTTIAGVTAVSGSDANKLNSPRSLVLDSNLNLYVADTWNNRIQYFQRC
ncbi:unnamed protein product [Rotaria magnacalcarata]|uniref:NHL repeat containing protein n=1 Tax=Rotaria magnacalcarata TaxID=392030 RepID=A0A815KKW1_9BILA|nr:unnamed protein product [Rotaria magnacalcarata]CAF1611525.1 unnamed protein product [Rotaria magnacalcarata]CAF4126734.1 unnamed protein product [Rotaria magnacalcarata]CAF4132460.1 unnamed protein product [Rotaria magnacalcarata]